MIKINISLKIRKMVGRQDVVQTKEELDKFQRVQLNQTEQNSESEEVDFE